MAKSNFSLSAFQASVGSLALARTNRFEVIITPPKIVQDRDASQLSSLYCEVANLPPLNLNVKSYKTYGPNHQRPIGSDYGGDGLSMTFHLDSGLSIKRFFDNWMESIVTRDTYNVNYQTNYATSILLRQLRPSSGADDKDEIMYELELLESFPRSMNIVEFNNSAQNQTQRLTVVFAYRYWRRTDIKKFAEPILSPPAIAALPQSQVNANKISNQIFPLKSNDGYFGSGNSPGRVSIGGSIRGIQDSDEVGSGSFG